MTNGSVNHLLGLFHMLTNTSGGESYITISKVIPSINELRHHLQVMKGLDKVSDVAKMLSAELDSCY